MDQHSHKAPRLKSASLWYIWLMVIAAVGVIFTQLFFPDSINNLVSRLKLSSEPEILRNHSDRILVQTFERDGKRFLFGGESFDEHFDITELSLDVRQFMYGLGRETINTLLEPEFESVEEADHAYRDATRVLVAKIGQDVHVYPLVTLKFYELVNDRLGNVPIFAAYHSIAEFGAVYDRRFGEHELTFAVSGYTHHDEKVWDGGHVFVLWDRDTESLWWPPIGKAVSGPMLDQPLKLLDESMWAQTNWGEVKRKYPSAQVLKPGQPHTPPVAWPRLDLSLGSHLADAKTQSEVGDFKTIAPRWGVQATLPE
ncbi:MAG: DUF3179 domain-containing protein [Planctomycetes bacterium]|nr:DUF3179 domain-containing protein [Planctomycetota bacterium]